MFILYIAPAIFWFSFLSIIIFLIFFMMKISTFIAISRLLEPSKFNKFIDSSPDLSRLGLLLAGRLNKYLFIFPMMIFLNFLHLLNHAYADIYIAIRVIHLTGGIETGLLVHGMLVSTAGLMTSTVILYSYGIAWIIFYKWKSNILRMLKSKYYEAKQNFNKPDDQQSYTSRLSSNYRISI